MNTGVEDYKAARKIGIKQYKKALSEGKTPVPICLEPILQRESYAGQRDLGVIEIPLSLIVGTKDPGRENVFSPSFFPLLDETSEFARKWVSLFESQMEEGLRDPIKVYEYKRRFYVQEGNKRVSVMNYLKMPYIPASVIRIVPKKDDSAQSLLYQEFETFFMRTQLYSIQFPAPGDYDRLLKAMGKTWKDVWEEDEIKRLKKVYYQFSDIYTQENSDASEENIGSAFLTYLTIYSYEEACSMSKEEMRKSFGSTKKELKKTDVSDDVDHVMNPEPVKVSLLDKLIPAVKNKLKVAFIYEKKKEESAWLYQHDMGRLQMEEHFGDQVETKVYQLEDYNNDIAFCIEQVIAEGYQLIFTTSPTMMQASLKAAIKHEDVYFFNSSLNFPYKTVRTYYPRIYEVRFLLGLIAASMTDENVIGLEADYPIYGTVAGINAFAIAVQMVKPNAKVKLFWTCTEERELSTDEEPIDMILSKQSLGIKGRPFGLYKQADRSITTYATGLINWGTFYDHIVEQIMKGTWKNSISKEPKAINYWWGFSANAVDLILSDKLPYGTKRLVEKFREFMSWGIFHPFEGEIMDQNGVVHGKPGEVMATNDIIQMDWLCSNVIGHIPAIRELTPENKQIVDVQGVQTTKEIPKKTDLLKETKA